MNPEEKPTLPPLDVAPANATPPLVNPQQAVPVAGTPVISNVIGAEYAGVFTRFIAVLIDGILLSIISFPISIVINLLSASVIKSNPAISGVFQLIGFVVSLGILIYYYGVYQYKNGQTIGKKTMHIKTVLLTDGSTPSVGKFLLRETIFKMLSSIFMIGYLMAIFDAKKQSLHDKLAGTVVIKV